MSTTPKTTSAHIAGKFVSQAMKNTRQYLFECHAIQGTNEWYQRVYSTVVLGGINLALTSAQVKWIKRVLIAEGKTETDQWTGQVLVPTDREDTIELAGEWRLVESDWGTKVTHRMIYTMYTDYMVHALGISASDIERATFLGCQQGVVDAMLAAICKEGVKDVAPGMAFGRNIDGAVLLIGREKLADGGGRFAEYMGPFGEWWAPLDPRLTLAEMPQKKFLS